MDYISVSEAAKAWGLTNRRVQVLCSEGRIEGVVKIGNLWAIPADAEKPSDGRAERYNNETFDSNDIKPLSSSVIAKGHTPQYKMHKYFARRPYNVFSHLVKHYSKKGDIILDCFCGGGVTVFESAALGRKPIGVDLNPLAAFITRMQMFNGNVSELEEFYNRFLTLIKKLYSSWYDIIFDDDCGTALWTEWVYTVSCPNCGELIELSELNKVSNGIYKCPNDCCPNHTGVKRVNCKNVGSTPIRVLYRSKKSGKDIIRKVSFENIRYYKDKSIGADLNELEFKPQFDIPENWDRQHEDKLYEKGVVTYSDFFTERNYALNCLVFNEIMQMKKEASSRLNEYLYFLFSSSLRYTNKMARVTDNWEGGKPTAMDKHAFWLPNQYVETNIIDVLEKRAKVIINGCTFAASAIPSDCIEVCSFEDIKLKNAYMVLNQSSSNLPIPDESVDVIITDPPYGSNVQYAELSSIWNAWYKIYNNLDNFIFKDEEAVVNRKAKIKGAKTEDDYERLLESVYSEGARVLRPDGYLVFTFNNKNIKVWIAMLKAVAMSGFYLPEDGILFQDYIESYKNTAHLRFSGNIQGDFIYSFRKGKTETQDFSGLSLVCIIESTVSETVKKLFARRKQYSTPVLYQKIMASLTIKIMQYVVWCKNKEIEVDNVSDLSNAYLENLLKKDLTCNDGVWEKTRCSK